jgi:hypothetical protein
MIVFGISAKAEESNPNSYMTIEADKIDFQAVQIYVDIAEIQVYDNSSGTSRLLNIMIADEAQRYSMLESKLHYHSGHKIWEGNINVYDWTNIQHMPTYKQCNYNNAIKCGIQNKHWTLRTIVWVGKQFSLVTIKLYNEKGLVIGNGSKRVTGTINWKPRWKLTRIKEQGPFGAGSKEIFEQWPPLMEEVPPLITDYTVGQAMISVYDIKLLGCTTNYCLEKQGLR